MTMGQIIGGLTSFAIIAIILIVKVRRDKKQLDNYDTDKDVGI